MAELIIGASGFIGSHLHKMIPDAIVTSRKKGSHRFLNLLDIHDVPECHVCYLCAGMNGAYPCAHNPTEARQINVDAPVALAKLVGKRIGFLVHISSMSVEWNEGVYTRTKQAAEAALLLIPSVGIVRAGRVINSNVDSLCKTLIRVGRERESGVTRWGSDGVPYQR